VQSWKKTHVYVWALRTIHAWPRGCLGDCDFTGFL
jgi:hypothetical protein